MTKIPPDDILEGLYKLSIRESEKLKTVLELYDLETHQKKIRPDYHRLKTMVKRSIEQDIRNKNFGARNGNYERNAVVKNHGTKQRSGTSSGFMGRETEDRVSPILVGNFSKDRWLITHFVPFKGTQHRWIIGKLVNDVIMCGVQTLVVKPDQEASIVDVKNALMRELRGVEGLTVMPEESPVGASAANALMERSVWEMQSTTTAVVAHAEWVHGTVFEPGSAILTWVVELSGQVVSRFRRSVSDGKTAYERQKLIGEVVMFMPIEKPKDKGEVRNCVGIMLGLVDRSDEVVIGTTERVVKARTAHRMPVGQRDDAAYAKSMRGVPWQPNTRRSFSFHTFPLDTEYSSSTTASTAAY